MKSEAIVKMELKNLIKVSLMTLEETRIVWENKKEITAYEKGKYDGILLISRDFIDNFVRFGNRIGLDFKKLEGGKK